ncbi:MAG TPA: hypothetical protein VJ489_01435, partial [Thermoplasmata archaeon]|nr:hypothetical protein [Thermoplasmata archaeon]
MADGLYKAIDSDMSMVPLDQLAGADEREKVMKALAHLFLRLWTRLALESGQRLKMTPSQFTLGTYEGQMRWSLNTMMDFRNLPQLEMGEKFKKKHSLIGETYQLKADTRVRLVFSLEEEEVRARPVMINYLVYDESVKQFGIKEAMDALKPVLPSWIETISTANDAPLWDYC